MPGQQAGHSVVVQPRVNGRNGNMRVDSRQRVAGGLNLAARPWRRCAFDAGD